MPISDIFKNRKNTRRCCFVHIPKTAGTSLVDSLSRSHQFQRHESIDLQITRRLSGVPIRLNTPSEDTTSTFDQFVLETATTQAARECVVSYFLQRRWDLITGHFLFSKRLVEVSDNQYEWITVLRHPVERFLSNYEFGQSTKLSLDHFLETDLARMFGACTQHYLSGPEYMLQTFKHPDIVYEICKKNLSCFRLIGFQDNLDVFTKSLSQIFKFKISLKHQNVTKRSLHWENLNTEQKTKVERLCEADIRVYEYALNQFPIK